MNLFTFQGWTELLSTVVESSSRQVGIKKKQLSKVVPGKYELLSTVVESNTHQVGIKKNNCRR